MKHSQIAVIITLTVGAFVAVIEICQHESLGCADRPLVGGRRMRASAPSVADFRAAANITMTPAGQSRTDAQPEIRDGEPLSRTDNVLPSLADTDRDIPVSHPWSKASGSGHPRDIRVPVVFQGSGQADAVLSPAQQAAVSKIQEDFASATQTGGSDPSSPDYLRRWNQAQQDADTRLRQVLGWQGYLQYSLAQARQEYIDSGGHRINTPMDGPS